MLKIIGSVQFCFRSLKKTSITKPDEHMNTHSQDWKPPGELDLNGFLTPALVNTRTSHMTSIKPLHFGLHCVCGEKQTDNMLKVHASYCNSN